METILNRFMMCGQVKELDGNNFLWVFEKNWFFTFLTQHFYQKNENVKKWEKVSFDNLFELAIVDLVGIEYQIVKIGQKLWFLQVFFCGHLLLYYYKY